MEEYISQYPDLPADKIADLVRWFNQEATPKEIAAMVRKSGITDNYKEFRDTHLQRMTTGGAILATGFGIVLILATAVAAGFP